MSENVCDNRPLALPNPDTNISNIKQEFSSIFYEYNLDTFAEAAELGFYNNNKSPLRSEMLPSDENESTQEETTKKEYISQNGAIKPPACSTDTFFTSNVSFTSSHKKPLEQGGLVVSRRPSQTLEQSPFLNIKEFFQSNEYIDTHPDEPLDLVWSNEPSKLAEHKTSNSCVFPLKIKQEEQHNQKGQNYPMKKIDADDLLQYEYLSYSNPLEYFSKPDKDFPRPSKVKKEEEVTFGHHDMSSMSMQLERNPFPIKALDDDKKSFSNKRPWNPPAPPIKRAETCPVVEDDDKDAKNRSSRGLRVLSLRVKDIVGEKKKTSYKEVADILTDETLQLLKGKEEPRDEQNIKRRAYDALNVLIAADILKKEGKVVYCDDDLASIGINKRKQMKEEKEGMEKRIFELKKKNKATTESMKELMFKFLAIKNLIKRNKHDTEDKKLALHSSETESTSAESTRKLNRSNSGCNPTRIDVVKNCPDFKFNNEDVIRFPFIVLVSSTPENSMNLNMAGRQRRLEIESSSPFNIFGDIDVLLKMKLHHVPYTFVKECIPRGIENYLSQSDLETFEH